MRTPERILIARTDRLGDLVLSTPVIKNIRDYFPRSRISFLCRPYTREVLEGNPWLDEVIIYDKYGKDKSFAASLRFAESLRKKRFDLALILHPTLRMHLLTFLAAIPVRAGWKWSKGSFLLNRGFRHLKHKGQKHELEYNLDLLRGLGIPVETKTMYFPLKKESQDRIKELLQSRGVGDKDLLIVLHPAASCPSRRWPIAHFSLLSGFLQKDLKVKIAVISTEKEKDQTEQLLRDHREMVDLRGRLDVSGLGALLDRADLLIANDSGPVHIAAALDTPVISIFSRNDPGLSPRRWQPLGMRSFYLHKDVGCRQCLAHNCQKGFLCLEAISPEEVSDLAHQIIDSGFYRKRKKL